MRSGELQLVGSKTDSALFYTQDRKCTSEAQGFSSPVGGAWMLEDHTCTFLLEQAKVKF